MIRSLYTLYFIFLPIPLFFTTELHIFNVEVISYAPAGIELISVGFLVSSIFILFIWNKIINCFFNRNTFFLAIFLLLCLVFFCIKVALEGADASPLLLMVSVLPLAVNYCYGFSFRDLTRKDFRLLNDTVNKSILAFFAIVAAHLIYSFSTLGIASSFSLRGSDSVAGMFSIHQKLVYFPTVTASMFILTLFSTSRHKRIIAVGLFLEVMMIASREGMLLALLGVLARVYYLSVYEKKTIKMLAYIVFWGVALLLSAPFILSFFEESTFIEKFVSLGSNGDFSAGRLGEVYMTIESFNKPDFSYFIGTGFSMTLGEMGTPHNQYVEILYRGGVIGLACFVLCVLYALVLVKENMKKYRGSQDESFNIVFCFSVIFVLFTFISFNINTPVRSMYACGLYGFLMGFLSNRCSNRIE